MPITVVEIMLGSGTALVLALGLAAISGRLHLPHVTAYIVAGVVIGPSVLGHLAHNGQGAFARTLGLFTLSPDLLEALSPLTDLALALIMFQVGGEFILERFRRSGRRILALSFIESAATAFAVAGLALIIATPPSVAILLGIIAMATAPGATLVVIRELDSEGPLTHNILLLVGLNNLLCLVAYPVAFALLTNMSSPVFALGREVAVLAAGGLLGLALSFFVERSGSRRNIVLLTLGGLILATGLSHLGGRSVDVLVMTFAMGLVCVNSSPRGREIFDLLDDVAHPLFVVFFILSGAHLSLGSLRTIGLLGLLYAVGRAAGKAVGALAATRLSPKARQDQSLVGLGLLCQAGCAIGLARDSVISGVSFGDQIHTVVLAAVLVFELSGPILLRGLLVRSGEVMLHSLHPKGVARHHAASAAGTVARLARAVGLRRLEKLSTGPQPLVEHLMRTNVDAIDHRAGFETVLNILAHGRYDLYPVVEDADRFLGVVTFRDLKEVIYEPFLAPLVIARDMMSGRDLCVAPTTPLEEALRVFDDNDVSCLPVVTSNHGDRPVLAGIVERRDVTRAYREEILERQI